MSNKNPFEIRAEMLQLAKEYMDQLQDTQFSIAAKMFEIGQIQLEEYQKMTEMYSVEELKEKAKEMYSFVSTKDQSPLELGNSPDAPPAPPAVKLLLTSVLTFGAFVSLFNTVPPLVIFMQDGAIEL